jgi:hypothetical protein
MNVVFLNTLEKQVEEGRVKSAQVTIGEAQGVWQIVWSEATENAKMIQDSWYQGVSWDELCFSVWTQGENPSGLSALG